MFQEPDQPIVADRVEKRSHVAIQNVVHPPTGNPESQRIQRIVLTALRAKPVAEPQEVFLVYRIEYAHRGALDDLVSQRRTPNGRCPSPFGI